MRIALGILIVLNILALAAGARGDLARWAGALLEAEAAHEEAASFGGPEAPVLALVDEPAPPAGAADAAPERAQDVPAVPGPAPELAQESDRSAEEQPPPEGAEPPPEAPPKPPVLPERTDALAERACLRVGPFTDPDARIGFEQALRDHGGRLLDADVEPLGTVRHWVVLEGFEDVSAAMAAEQRLRGAGFSDVGLVEQPEGWLVSLGLFAQHRHARRHRDAARSAGFPASLRRRGTQGERATLRIALPAGSDVEALRGMLPAAALLDPCE